VRLAIRLAGILVVLAVVALLGPAVALTRLAASDAARVRIQELVREATGREIRYGELDLGLLPPRLVVSEAEVKGKSDGSPPVFEAAEVELAIAIAPLMTWTVVVDSLVIEGATVRLVRTPDGIEIPREVAAAEASTAPGAPSSSSQRQASEPAADAAPSSSQRQASEPGEDAATSPPQRQSPGEDAAPSPSQQQGSERADDENERGFALEIREVTLRDCRLILEDRTVSPPATWELGDVVATASGQSMEDPIGFEINGDLISGGSVRATGKAEIGVPFRIDFQLEGVALAPATPYLARGQRVGGAVTGTVTTQRAKKEAERVVVDVLVRGGELAADDLTFRGEMKIRADLQGGTGSFQLDATEAEVEYGAMFSKGRGTAATATGRIVTGPDGQIGLEDTQVKIENFEAEVQVKTGARTRTRIDAEPFDLAGWETMIPALEGYDPAGELGIRGLVVTTEPLEVRGDLDLHDVRLRRGDGAEMVLRGGFRGTGSGIRSEKLVARIADQEIRLSIDLTGLAGRPRFAAEVEADAVESSALLALVTEKNDTLQGPLELRGKLTGPLGADRPVAETLEGTMRFRIEPGRLKGVSVLEKTFQGLGSAGDAALIAGRLKGGRTLQRFYDDEFQYLGGTLQIARGLARTDDLKLVYHNYTVDLLGTVGLQDQQLDLRGKLTIDDEIDGAIASEGTSDPQSQPGRSRVIPLARVSGTLESPRVEITDEAVIRLAAIYATTERREEWEEKIDKYLGVGAGSQVLEALDGILSGEPQEPSQ
jgi:hypothetical protein